MRLLQIVARPSSSQQPLNQHFTKPGAMGHMLDLMRQFQNNPAKLLEMADDLIKEAEATADQAEAERKLMQAKDCLDLHATLASRQNSAFPDTLDDGSTSQATPG